MSLRLGALYDALLTAQGVSPEDAKNAAEEVAAYQTIAELRRRVTVLTWMMGLNLALTLLLLGGMASLTGRP